MKTLISQRDFVRIQEAAHILGVTEQTLRNWDKAGKLQARRNPANGYRMYRVADLHAFWRRIDQEPFLEPEEGQLSLRLPGSAQAPPSDIADLPPCHWGPGVALDPKHRPQRWDSPSTTVRRDWRKYPQEAYVLHADGRTYRRFSVDEIAILQGIDPAIVQVPDLSNRRRIAALGDAVPPPVARAIAKAVDESWDWTNRTAVEFCAGIGGLAEGAASIGLDHRALVDFSPDCGLLLERHRPWSGSKVHVADALTFPFREFRGEVGLLSGGPPCQPWSRAGHGRGVEDDRDLLSEVPRIVEEVAPEVFIIENVPGLASEQNKAYLREIVERLREPGDGLRYGVLAGTLNAADYGVPQTRQRLFIVGFRDASAADVYKCFDRIHSLATHCDPAHPRADRKPWVTVGEAIGGHVDPGGWRRWIGF